MCVQHAYVAETTRQYLLDSCPPPLVKYAWKRMKWWYQEAKYHAHMTACITTNRIAAWHVIIVYVGVFCVICPYKVP